ncbi:MAG: phage tail tape measure protein [Chlorobi bacterium]|nr:phage tail tape measure protein [Chlorobiota bacterium]
MAGRVLSIKIALDFSDIKGAFSKLKQEVESGIKGLGDGAEVPSPKPTPPEPDDNSAFNFNQVVQATEQISAAVEALSGPFREFDKALRDIGALGVKNFQDLENSILDFSKSVPDAAADIASAIGEGIGSGVIKTDAAGNVDPAEALAFAQTASQLAIAGGSSIGKAVSGIAATLNSYGMAATEAGKVSDILFNTFNLGVTSVDELAGYLSQVTPVAAAAGVKFEQIAASIATMTKQGIKTSDATTKVRALLVEMQKPTPALAAVMKQAGVSIEQIKNGELSLQSAAGKIGATLTALGKSAPQVFSSIEAATTVLSLSGANAATAMEDLEGIAKRGSVAEGFAVQAEGAEVKMKVLLNNVQAGFISLFSTLGGGLTAALGGIAQAAPTIATFANLKNLFPASISANIAKFATSLLSTLVPSLFVTNAATGTLTFSFGALWTAITGPVGIAIAAILAVGAALYLLYNNVEPVRKVLDALIGGVVGFAASVIDTVGPALSQIGSLLVEVGGLIFQWVVLPFRVGWEIVTAIWEAIAGLTGGIETAGSSGNILKDAFSFIRKIIIEIQGFVAGLSARISAVAKGIGDTVGKLLSGDVLGAAESFFGLGDSAADAFSKGFGKKVNEELAKLAIDEGLEALENRIAIRGDLDKAGKLADLRKQLAAAKTDAEKANITAAIAKEAPGAVESIEQVVDANGKVREVIKLNEEALDEFAATAKENGAAQNEDNNKIVLGILAQGDAYEKAKAKLKEQQELLSQRKAAGLDTTELEKDIADQQKVVATAKEEFEKSFTAAKTTGVFDNLDEEGKRIFANLQTTAKDSIAEIETGLRDKKLGEALAQATTINQKIDAQDQIGKFVADYKAAKTDVERANLAKAIGEQVPQAVTAYDELGNATEINVEKAQELANANKKTFGADLLKQQQGFTDGLKGQADELTKNRAKMEELQQQISKANDPKEIQRLQAEYAALKGKVGENVEKLQETVQEGKKVGLIKGDVKELGTEFKLSGEQAKSVGIAVEGIKDETKKAREEAKGLAEDYKKARAEMQGNISTGTGAALNKIEENIKLEKELSSIQKKNAAERTVAEQQRLQEIPRLIAANKRIIEEETKNTIAAVKANNAAEERERKFKIRTGQEQAKTEEKTATDITKFSTKLAEEAAKTRAGIASDAIADEVEREKQKKLDAANEAKAKLDADLKEQVAKINDAVKEGKPLEFEGKVVTKSEAIELANKAVAEAQKAVDERLQVDLAQIDKEGREKRLEQFKKDLAETAKIQAENSKIIGANLKAELEAIKGETATAATDRLAKRLEILQVERAAAVAAAISESDAYKNAFATLQLAQADLAAATTETEKEEAQKRVAASQAALDQTRKDLVANSPAIVRIIEQSSTEQARAVAEAEREIEDARERDRIAAIEDLAEQERELRLLELRKKEQEEIAAAEGNEAKIREVLRKSAKERQKIQQDYLVKSSILWKAYYTLLEVLQEQFGQKVDKERQRQLDEEKKKLGEEVQALKEQLKRKEITLEQFNQKFGDLAKERQKIAEEEAQATFDIGKAFQEAGIEVTSSIAETANAIASKSAEDYTASIDAKEAAVTKYGEASAEATKAEEDRSKALGKVYAASANVAIATFSKIVAAGGSASDAMYAALIDGALAFITAMLPAWVAAAYGVSVAQLGPFGLAVAAGLAAVLTGLAGIAKASLTSAKKAKDGEVPIRGKGGPRDDQELRWVSPGEGIINAQALGAGDNLAAVKWANEKRRPLREYYGLHNAPSVPRQESVELSKYAVSMKGTITRTAVQAQEVAVHAMQRVAAVEQQQEQIGESLKQVSLQLSAIRANTAHTAESTERTAGNTKRIAEKRERPKVL